MLPNFRSQSFSFPWPVVRWQWSSSCKFPSAESFRRVVYDFLSVLGCGGLGFSWLIWGSFFRNRSLTLTTSFLSWKICFSSTLIVIRISIRCLWQGRPVSRVCKSWFGSVSAGFISENSSIFKAQPQFSAFLIQALGLAAVSATRILSCYNH